MEAMKQTTRSLLGMLALVLAAGAVGGVALWARKDEEKKAEQKEKGEKLFDFDKSKARALRVEKEGKVVAALSRADDKSSWKITEPVVAEADDQTVSTMLDQLGGLKQKKDLADEKDAKSYGLDAPRLVVSLKLDDGKELGLQIGADNPFDNTAYVRKLGDPTIRIIDGYNKSNYDKSLLDLRDKRVAHLDDSAEIRRIEVSGLKTPYTLAKEGGKWKLGAVEADASVADRVAGSVKSLRATGIASEKAENLAQYGLDKAKVAVKLGVGTPGGSDTLTRTVLIGQPVKGGAAVKTFAKRDDSPVVFEVDAQIVKDLEKEPFDLQDKSLVHATREDVRKIVFDGPSGKLEIARAKDQPPDGGLADETFTVVAPQKGPAKKWKISSALYSITGLRATAFDGPAPKDAKGLTKFGLDKPRTVTLLGDKDAVLATVKVGAEKEGKRYVLAGDKVARVEKGTVDDLPWTLNDVLETPPPAASLPDGGVQASK
jgi:hypothetical protein